MRDLPPALQQMMLPMQVGQATQPFGSLEEGVRVLVICGRDEIDPTRANLRPGLQPDQRGAHEHARPPLPARPPARCGDRIPLEPGVPLMAAAVLASVPACRFTGRSRRHRPGSHRQMLGQSRRASTCRPSWRSATRGRSPRSGTARSRSSRTRAKPMRLRLWPAADPADRGGSTPTCLASPASPAPIARSMRWRLRSGLPGPDRPSAVVTGPVAKEQLYAIGFQHPGQTEFVAERCGISPGQRGDDAGRADAPHRSGDDPCAARRGRGKADQRADRSRAGGRRCAVCSAISASPIRGSRSPGSIPTRAKAARSAARRSRSSSQRSPRLRAEGWRVTGPHPADTMFHTARAGQLRRGAVHVPRPGADPDQGAALRGWASTSRSACRSSAPRPITARRSTSPARTAPTRGPMAAAIRWRRNARSMRSDAGLSKHAGAAARRHRPPRAQRKQVARAELHPRPPAAGADRGDSRRARRAARL